LSAIIHVIPRLNNGGAERLLLSSVPVLKEEVSDVVVISIAKKGELSDAFEAAGIEIIYLNSSCRMFDISIAYKIYKIIKKYKSPILVSHLLPANFFSALSSIALDVEHYLFIHNKNVDYSFSYVAVESLSSWLSVGSICVSECVLNFQRNNRLFRLKNMVLYNCVNQHFFHSDNKHDMEDFLDPGVRLVTVGRLVVHKRQKDILDAISQLSGFQLTSLTIVGDGPQLVDLKNYAKKINISDKCIFVGNQKNVTPYLRDNHIFVYASEREGNPLSLIEALAIGCIVVASNIDCHKEIITHGHNGFLFECGKVDQLTEVLCSMSMLSVDDIRLISKNARRSSLSFDPKVYADNFLSVVSSA